jgi:integral membrane protein (TIGR00529 family)
MIDWLLHLPAYSKVGVSFLGILLLNSSGVPLGLAILLFSILLPLWAGTGMGGLYYQIASFGEPQNYILPVIILLLLFFTESLSKTGRMDRTIAALKEWLKSKHIILAGLPALVGLLPMPAGALFSAPFVAAVDESGELELSHKVAINYWFRHIWEYWWPLYPGVILAMQYSRLPVIAYFLIQIPFTIVAVISGYIFILRRIKKEDDKGVGYGKIDTGEVLSAMGPIGLLVMISLVGSAILPLMGIEGTLANLIAMLVGLIAALVAIFSGHAAAFRPSLRMLMRIDTWLMIALVVGIQAFSAALVCPVDATGATLITGMRDEFIRTGIPLITVIMLIPFISGMVTGVAFGFVGASFPIVFALIGTEPTTGLLAATTVFAYSFGYMGMMLSPMHACFVVTAEYFGVTVFGAYRYIIWPVIIILITSIILSGLYYVTF